MYQLKLVKESDSRAYELQITHLKSVKKQTSGVNKKRSRVPHKKKGLVF